MTEFVLLWIYAGIIIFALVREKLGLAPEQWFERLVFLAILIGLWPALPLLALVLEKQAVGDIIKRIKDRLSNRPPKKNDGNIILEPAQKENG